MYYKTKRGNRRQKVYTKNKGNLIPDPRENLITALKQKALAYKQTGVNPDLMAQYILKRNITIYLCVLGVALHWYVTLHRIVANRYKTTPRRSILACRPVSYYRF